MNRRTFLKNVSAHSLLVAALSGPYRAGSLFGAEGQPVGPVMDAAQARDWLARWEKSIIEGARQRSCDTELGEELGWLVSPYLNGFYYGYRATRDLAWVERLIDWTDSCIRRGVQEPDGFMGWPKGDGDGKEAGEYHADSLLGEAMLLRPVVLMAGEILKTPALEPKWGAKARGYLELAGQVFDKWDSRDCWREVRGGGLWVVPAFGIDRQTGKWSAGYAQRKTGGISNPANKQNHIARWIAAMHAITGKTVYRERAEKWFQLMRRRMSVRDGGRYFVWNYWEPAGPWDYKADGSPRHWIGVHPNGVYYAIDVAGIVTAFEQGLVFVLEDIDRLVATNRDFMWNRQLAGAEFQRIDGRPADPRWKNSAGVLWTSLLPYDATLRKIFLANHDPASWKGLETTPWFLASERI
jgi:hypothetical protein